MRIIVFPILLICLLSGGCVFDDRDTPHYSSAFHCVQPESELRDVAIEMYDRAGRRFDVGCGVLGGLGTKEQGLAPRPMPISGTIRWMEDGVPRSQDLAIAASVPDNTNFEGEVFFLYDKG